LLPGDISATDRYFHEDITPPFILTDGRIAVPEGPGLGVEVDRATLDRLTSERETIAGGVDAPSPAVGRPAGAERSRLSRLLVTFH